MAVVVNRLYYQYKKIKEEMPNVPLSSTTIEVPISSTTIEDKEPVSQTTLEDQEPPSLTSHLSYKEAETLLGSPATEDNHIILNESLLAINQSLKSFENISLKLVPIPEKINYTLPSFLKNTTNSSLNIAKNDIELYNSKYEELSEKANNITELASQSIKKFSKSLDDIKEELTTIESEFEKATKDLCLPLILDEITDIPSNEDKEDKENKAKIRRLDDLIQNFKDGVNELGELINSLFEFCKWAFVNFGANIEDIVDSASKVTTDVDKAFNSYDTAYVVPTGKNWKLTLKNQNWIDNYSGGLDGNHAMFTSGAASNIGLYLSFMAVSVGYSLDVDRLFGAKGTSQMMEFSFTCARFTAEAHKITNTGRMSTRIKLDGGEWKKGEKLDALRRESMGVSATYFFNNRKYARAAAYCYSKFQRRSAGSALAGFSIVNYDFKVDTEKLTPDQAQKFEYEGVTVTSG